MSKNFTPFIFTRIGRYCLMTVVVCGLLCFVGMPREASARSEAGLFGTREVERRDISAFHKWLAMLDRHNRKISSSQSPKEAIGTCRPEMFAICGPQLKRIDPSHWKHLSGRDLIDAVNRGINRAR
ncbi:MAG: hypothetical protein AAGF15_00340, partial [Pseudomonadota bacterium]